jgi:hypothetical protein
MSSLDSKVNYISRIGADLRQDFAAVIVPEMVTQILLVEILEELKVIESLLENSQNEYMDGIPKAAKKSTTSKQPKGGKSLKK